MMRLVLKSNLWSDSWTPGSNLRNTCCLESITDVWTSPNFVDSRRSQPITIPSDTYNTIQPIENLLCGSYQYNLVT